MNINSLSSNEAYYQSQILKKEQTQNVAETQDGASTESSSAISSEPRYDTVTVSDEGQELLDAQQSSKAAPPPPAPATESEDSEEETDVSFGLSNYTEAQLQDMVDSGEISQAEYNTEIARREAESAQQQALDQQQNDIGVSQAE